MPRPSWLQRVYWTRFAKPVEQRALFAELLRRPISSVLEVGIGDGTRLRRVAELAQLASGCEQLRYIGTDEFEASSSGRHLSLKQAHQLTSQLGFKASLIPGDTTSAIPRVAHKFAPADLIIADGCLDPANPAAGFVGEWLTRLTHEGSVIVASSQLGGTLQIVAMDSILSAVRTAA